MSSILLFDDRLLVANRRVRGPYPTYIGDAEDTIAVFESKKATLIIQGHIYTGCWKPRELIRVKAANMDHLAITCNGQFAQGGGVVLVDMAESFTVVGRWDSGRMSVGGIVSLTSNFTT